MKRENKKEEIAYLIKTKILEAAEKLFSEKGFEETTIEDISVASEYSRRTVYAYFESKDDILHHIIEKGLKTLKAEIEAAFSRSNDFFIQIKAVFIAIKKYKKDCPHSFESVYKGNSESLDSENLSETVASILSLGTEINELLEALIRRGKERGIVRQDIVPIFSVYIMWSGICSLITLTETKGKYIYNQYSVTEDEFLEYGFKQILNSILEIEL